MCRRARRRQGPVLAILAMLALLRPQAREAELRVAPGCCALPLTPAARGGLLEVSGRGASPSLRSGSSTCPAGGVEQGAGLRRYGRRAHFVARLSPALPRIRRSASCPARPRPLRLL